MNCCGRARACQPFPLEYNECNLVVREGRGKREEAEQVLEIVISPPIQRVWPVLCVSEPYRPGRCSSYFGKATPLTARNRTVAALWVRAVLCHLWLQCSAVQHSNSNSNSNNT